MSETSSTDRTYDLVVFGATSFVGQILCRYLVGRHGTNGPLRWAIAGRNQSKLETTAADTGAEVPRIVADAKDLDAMNALAASTRVLVSTVGPYALYGSDLVHAAVASGTDYVDLTGEAQWVQRMIDAHVEQAASTGARIVHACGFDSIPSDLGVWFTQQRAQALLGEPCTSIAMRVKAMKGGASGGTIASAMNVFDEVANDKTLRKVLANPYALAPSGMRSGPRQPNVTVPKMDEHSNQWIAPFVMAAVNTKIVLRTHALLGQPWGGDSFQYDEATMMGPGAAGALKAGGMTAALGGFMGAAAVGPIRRLLNDRVLPKPGTGPTPEEQKAGFFDLRFFGTTASGDTITTKVTGDADPGYGSTARMLGEAATTLLSLDRAAVGGGFHTPASAFGDSLIGPLVLHAGLTFEVIDN